MEPEFSVKNWLTATVLEYACKNDFSPVVEHILKDQELLSNIHVSFVECSEKQKVSPVFLFIHILKKLLSSVEAFASQETSYTWNSDALPVVIQLLEKTYQQYEFISLKKFFSLLSQLKFLDMMYFLRLNAESSILMHKLNIHFPRWTPIYKAALEKQFSIENSKFLEKVEESYSQCRRLMLKLTADLKYKRMYMSEQFSNDMKKMMLDSETLLKEVIHNLLSNTGLTVIEKAKNNEIEYTEYEDLGYQLLLDYFQADVTSDLLLKFLDEMDPALAPPSGGFSSCLLPFDTMSECSEVSMESELDENDSESAEESDVEMKKTITNSGDEANN